MIRRAYARVSDAWWRFRVRRLLKRRGDADDYPLFIGAIYLASLLTLELMLPGCAHRANLRRVDAIEARCMAEIDPDSSDEVADAHLDACIRQIDGVGR